VFGGGAGGGKEVVVRMQLESGILVCDEMMWAWCSSISV
jgi:hypothetical protein